MKRAEREIRKQIILQEMAEDPSKIWSVGELVIMLKGICPSHKWSNDTTRTRGMLRELVMAGHVKLDGFQYHYLG